MTNNVNHVPSVATASDLHSYVCKKIGAHLGPIPRRVLLSEIQTDPKNPFNPRTLHHDLMGVLCDLESSEALVVDPSGIELSPTNFPST
jgi:hypothetical protein